MAKTERKKLLTPEFRGSYVHLVKPRSFGEGDPKFQIVMVLDKKDPFWDELEDAIEAAAKERFDGTVPKGLMTPIKDGDEPNDEGDEMPEEFHGCYYVRFQSTERPGIVDGDLEDVTERSEIYSGAWYRASIRPYGWHYKAANRKGVSIQLDNVQKVRDDEPFSGKSKAEDDFADHVGRGRGRRAAESEEPEGEDEGGEAERPARRRRRRTRE